MLRCNPSNHARIGSSNWYDAWTAETPVWVSKINSSNRTPLSWNPTWVGDAVWRSNTFYCRFKVQYFTPQLDMSKAFGSFRVSHINHSTVRSCRSPHLPNKPFVSSRPVQFQQAHIRRNTLAYSTRQEPPLKPWQEFQLRQALAKGRKKVEVQLHFPTAFSTFV